jgi:hypothetical protein
MNKMIFGSLLLGCASLAHALAFNVTNLTTNPGQPLPTTILPGQTLSAFYTVQNNSRVTRNNNYVKHFPANTTQVTGPGLCGKTFNLAPNGTCLLQLSITGPTDGKITPLMVCFTGGLTCAGTQETLNVISGSTSSGSAVRAVVGGPTGNTTLRFESSVDNLTTWQSQTTSLPSSSSPPNIALNCIGSGDNALCVAALTTDPSAGGIPISTSTNGGKTWTPASELLTSSGINLFGVSCTNSWFCAAAGNNAYFAIRNNASGIWNDMGFTITTNYIFLDTACAANGSICLAVGNDGGTNPAIALSTSPDTPSTWGLANLSGIAGVPPGPLSTGSCAADGAICIAAGAATVVIPPQPPTNLIQTLNKGGIWSVAPGFTTPPVTAPFSLNGSSCTDTGSTTWCVAAGSDTGATIPGGQIWQTFNQGAAWSLVAFTPVLSATSNFKAVSCTGTQSNGLCVAVGNDTATNPLIAINLNPAAAPTPPGDWTVVPNGTITGFSSTNATLNNVSCTGTGTTAICAAVGIDNVSGNSLLIKTYDGGTTWAVDTTSVASSTTFNAVSLTGGQ